MADDVPNRVKKIIVNHLGVSESKIQDNAKFIEDLGADSLDTVELVMAFEEKFGIDIPDDLQGDSFRKIVNNTSSKWRDAIYYTYYEYPSVHMVKRHYGVRTDRYKLMHFYYDIVAMNHLLQFLLNNR